MSYGNIGTSPLSDLPKTVEKLLSDFLKANYDQTITETPSTDILWDQWYSGSFKDYGIYFQDVGDFDVSTEISWSLFDIDHFTEIHVFARSTHDDYERSADKMLFQFDKWIKKTIRNNKTGLADQGIMVMEYKDARNIPVEDDMKDIKRKVITIRTKMMLINNNNLA
jgi:hypothetical protein